MTLRNYIKGYGISIVLTLLAFVLVMNVGEGLSAKMLLVLLVVLAVAQLFVQLFYFLHLGAEAKPRWHLITFVFAAFIVIVLVGGTIWIMYHLDKGHDDLSELYPSGAVSPEAQDD